MGEIGSSAFPFRLETFLKNGTEIDIRALLTADLGEFTPQDFLYEFYTRTSSEIAGLKRKLRRINSDNPQMPGGIVMLRKECKATRSRISKLEKDAMALQKRKIMLEESRRLELSTGSSYKSQQQHPTRQNSGVTLPAIQIKDTRIPKVRPPSARPNKNTLKFPQIN